MKKRRDIEGLRELAKDLGKPEGLNALLALIELDDKSEEVYNGLLELIDYFFGKEMYKEAEVYCVKALLIYPENEVLRTNLGTAFLNQGNYSEAETFLKQALELNPEYNLAWLNLGFLYHKQGKWSEAIEVCLQAVELDPKNMQALFILGYCFKELENYPKAIEALQKVIELQPNNPEVWTELGENYFYLTMRDNKIENSQKAVEACQYAIKLVDEGNGIIDNTDKIQPLKVLGFCFDNLENYPKSMEAWQKLVELVPNEAGGWAQLGLSYARQEKYPEAINSFKKSLKLDPTDKVTRGNLKKAKRNKKLM